MNEYEKQKNVGRIENRDSTYSKEYLVCLEKDQILNIKDEDI